MLMDVITLGRLVIWPRCSNLCGKKGTRGASRPFSTLLLMLWQRCPICSTGGILRVVAVAMNFRLHVDRASLSFHEKTPRDRHVQLSILAVIGLLCTHNLFR